MNTTIRTRAAALGIAAVAGLAGVCLSSGSALAATKTETGPGSEAATAVAEAPQSAGHPNDSADYADRMVRAWGIGDDSRVEDLALPEVADALAAHGDEHATRWHRVGADAGAGSAFVAYTNWDTGEVMTLRVDNERAVNGDAMGAREVKFHG